MSGCSSWVFALHRPKGCCSKSVLGLHTSIHPVRAEQPQYRTHVSHTNRAPVTKIKIPPSGLEGWASRVATWCLT